MVGLLNAPRGTRLYRRLSRENRLLKEFTGDNMDFSLNFTPKMNYETLINGYHNILQTIYSPRYYYERVRTLLKEYKPQKRKGRFRIQFNLVTAFIKSMWFVGIKEKGRKQYWELVFSTPLKYPRSFTLYITLAVYGYHFRKVIEKYIPKPVRDSIGLNQHYAQPMNGNGS